MFANVNVHREVDIHLTVNIDVGEHDGKEILSPWPVRASHLPTRSSQSPCMSAPQCIQGSQHTPAVKAGPSLPVPEYLAEFIALSRAYNPSSSDSSLLRKAERLPFRKGFAQVCIRKPAWYSRGAQSHRRRCPCQVFLSIKSEKMNCGSRPSDWVRNALLLNDSALEFRHTGKACTGRIGNILSRVDAPVKDRSTDRCL
jgi:hypothetical protein